MNALNGIQSFEESENSQLLKVSSIDREELGPPQCEDNNVVEESDFDIKEISYAIGAFYATLQPVAITLVLSSLVVVYVKSPFSQQSGDGGLSIYDISDGSEASINDSNTVKLGKSMINALVIVCAMALMTFVIVFLYWARCMQCIQGYMIFSSFMLLSFMGGVFFYTVICQSEIPLDWITFFVVLYNFSVVGVIAIFFQRGTELLVQSFIYLTYSNSSNLYRAPAIASQNDGIPSVMTQGYLISTSILLVWQLSRFDEYTCFSLLVALSFYDLCAVLSPCGPLKALVGLMQERNVPLPGLLYEANMSGRSRGRTLSNGSNSSANSSTTSRRRSNNDNNSNNNINNDIETSRKSKNRRNGKKNMDFVIERGSKPLVAGNSEECSPSTGCRTPLASILYSTKRNDHDISDTVVRDIRKKQCTAVPALPDVLITNTSIQNPIFFGETFRNLREDMNDNSAHPLRSALGLGSATVLGVGKGTYEDGGVDMKCQSPRTDELDIDYLSFSSKSSSTSPFHHPSSSFDSVRGNVREDNDGVMRGDKTVDANDNDDSESEYYSDSNSSSGKAAGHRSSIKLGLGDFVFYSLLVSRSSTHGFPTFIATSFVVLAGLGATLALLAVYKRALPALPISILLGVMTYFLTRYCLEPFLTTLTEQSLYI